MGLVESESFNEAEVKNQEIRKHSRGTEVRQSNLQSLGNKTGNTLGITQGVPLWPTDKDKTMWHRREGGCSLNTQEGGETTKKPELERKKTLTGPDILYIISLVMENHKYLCTSRV